MTADTHTFLHVSSGDRRGGGVGIFTSKSFSKIKKEKVPKTDNFELMQASCIYGGKKLVFIIVYRSPSSDEVLFRDEFRLYIESLNVVGSEVLVCGDFNFWVDDVENESAKYFIETMNLLGYGTRAFERSAPRLFNKLPLGVKQSPNCSVFKKRLKTHVFADCYQSGQLNPSYRV